MKHKAVHKIPGACSFLWAGFIWSNSLKSGAESGEASAGFTALINNMLGILSLDGFSEHFVRKAAHFTEFAILGLLIALSVLPLTLKRRWGFAAVVSLAAACVDELLQLLTAGRSCELGDVIIDFSGAVLGISAVLLVSWLKKRESAGLRRK